MKPIKYLSVIVLTSVILLTGCVREEIDYLRRQQEENAARITLLEIWQQTINNNITALQVIVTALETSDYVTGVVPFTTPAPGGYRISFSKSNEAIIWNGNDGEKGDKGDTGDNGKNGSDGHTPVIGVAESPQGSGVYYWTLNGTFIEQDGKKIPVTGAKGEDGLTPTVNIGADGYWYINGNNTGVKAKGEDGKDGTTPTITISDDGYWVINGVNTGVKAKGEDGDDGITPTITISDDGYWIINGTKTAIKAKGEDGKDGTTPTITISDDGYWVINGTKTTIKAKGEDGNDGQNGSTPKVIIGTDNYWYVSNDGTATGIPPAAPSSGWTNTNVKATGANGTNGSNGATGATGPQGDAIFASGGIDTTHVDYVIFTLAGDDDPPKTIKLQKYKGISIVFTQPGVFTAATSQTITYTIPTGGTAPDIIRIVDVPNEWKCAVDISSKKITITPPATLNANNCHGEATVLIGVDNQVHGMYVLELTGDFNGPASNTVGAYYYQKGVATGIVYKINDDTAGSGRVVSIANEKKAWGPNAASNATDENDGFKNMNTVYVDNNSSFDGFPAFEFVHNMNPVGTTYENKVTDIWWLPSWIESRELSVFNNVYNSSWSSTFIARDGKNQVRLCSRSPNQQLFGYTFHEYATIGVLAF